MTERQEPTPDRVLFCQDPGIDWLGKERGALGWTPVGQGARQLGWSHTYILAGKLVTASSYTQFFLRTLLKIIFADYFKQVVHMQGGKETREAFSLGLFSYVSFILFIDISLKKN